LNQPTTKIQHTTEEEEEFKKDWGAKTAKCLDEMGLLHHNEDTVRRISKRYTNTAAALYFGSRNFCIRRVVTLSAPCIRYHAIYVL
jgi:hypothetical protein